MGVPRPQQKATSGQDARAPRKCGGLPRERGRPARKREKQQAGKMPALPGGSEVVFPGKCNGVAGIAGSAGFRRIPGSAHNRAAPIILPLVADLVLVMHTVNAYATGFNLLFNALIIPVTPIKIGYTLALTISVFGEL